MAAVSTPTSQQARLAGLEQLPLEITLDIMSRLPADSVISCKSVCRSWHFHLNNHHFSRLHLQQQKKQITSGCNQFDFLINYKIPDINCTRGQEFQYLQYIDTDHNTDSAADHENQVVDQGVKDEYHSTLFSNYRLQKIDHPLLIDYPYRTYKDSKSCNYFVRLVGSCDGLVCLSFFGDPTYICNPLTREYLNLPRHDQYHDEFNDKNSTSCMACGFGQHHLRWPINNADVEYKVVRIFYEKWSRDCKGQVQVYTVGKDRGRWRNIGQISHWLYTTQRGVLVNGTLYWMTTMHPTHGGRGIMGFDLAKEEFYALANLPTEWVHNQKISRMRELGGCLSLICNRPTLHLTEVWVMKNYTIKNSKEETSSWVKEFSISENWSLCDPFTLTKHGKILAWYNNQHRSERSTSNPSDPEVFLRSYHPKTGKFEQYVKKIDAKITNNTYYGAVRYIKSLISLKDLGEEDVGGVGRHQEGQEMSLKRKAYLVF